MPSHALKVALVRPPVDVLCKFSKPVENLAIGYLATALRRGGHEAVMLDGMLHGWSVDQTVARILAEAPSVVGFTVVLQYFPRTLATIIDRLRAEGYGGLLLVGGHSVSFFPERIVAAIPGVDAVVCGEGETAMREIADAIAAGRDWRTAPGLCFRGEDGVSTRTPVRRIRDLDSLGDPARDLTREIIRKDGLVAISTSRGCYARCSFCSIPRFYGLEGGRGLSSGDWRARSVARTVAEVADLHDRFGLRELLVVDDEFFGGTASGLERALSLGRALEDLRIPLSFALSCRAENVDEAALEQLRRGGLAHVFVGVETGSDQVLKLYGKRQSSDQNRKAIDIIRGLGLSFQPGFMLFNYRTTLDELKTSLDFLLEIGECKPVTLNSGVDPHFGTPLLTDMRRKDLLEDKGLTMSCAYSDPRVAAIRRIADLCVEDFQPYMQFLAGVRSAVTYEWRRRVPHRQAREEHLLDTFEDTVNRSFTEVVIAAVDDARAHPRREAAELLADAQGTLARVREKLQLSHAIVVAQLVSAEGGISYVSQLDLIPECGQPAARAQLGEALA